MKKITLLALLIFGYTTMQAQSPDIAWQYVEDDVDGAGNPIYSYVARSVITTEDGGYVVAGFKMKYEDYMPEFAIRKIDADGQLVWETDLVQEGIYGEGFEIVAAEDGYIVVGQYYDYDFTYVDYGLIKLDSEGQFVEKIAVANPNGTSEFQLTELILASDGNLVMAGLNRITKMDTEGNYIWNNSFGENVLYYVNDLVETSDGNYAVAGKNSGIGGSTQNMLWRFNADGTAGAISYYGDSYYNNSSSLLAAPNGGIIYAGSQHTQVGIQDDFWVAEINADNEIVWEEVYGGGGQDVAYGIARTSDDGYVLTGRTNSINGDPGSQTVAADDIWVIKIGVDGTLEWQKRLGVTNAEYAEYGGGNSYNGGLSVVQSADLNYVIGGYTAAPSSTDIGGANMTIYKLVNTLEGGLSLSQEINSCSEAFSPVITLSNAGTTVITAAEITYQLDDATTQTYLWTGELGVGGTAGITLTELTASVGIHTLTASITAINGAPYDNAGESAFTEEFRISRFETQTVTLSLQLDDAPEETTWGLKDGEGIVLYSGGPYSEPGSLVNETFDLAQDDCYTFTIGDSGSDGIIGGTEGFYQLANDDGEIFAENGEFGAGESANFFILTFLATDNTGSQLFTMYPNPVTDVLSVSASNGTIIDTISVYNVAGQKIDTFRLMDGQVNLDRLANGIYFIRVENSQNESATYKVIKE